MQPPHESSGTCPTLASEPPTPPHPRSWTGDSQRRAELGGGWRGLGWPQRGRPLCTGVAGKASSAVPGLGGVTGNVVRGAWPRRGPRHSRGRGRKQRGRSRAAPLLQGLLSRSQALDGRLGLSRVRARCRCLGRWAAAALGGAHCLRMTPNRSRVPDSWSPSRPPSPGGAPKFLHSPPPPPLPPPSPSERPDGPEAASGAVSGQLSPWAVAPARALLPSCQHPSPGPAEWPGGEAQGGETEAAGVEAG